MIFSFTNSISQRGFTALHCTCECGHDELSNHLIALNADVDAQSEVPTWFIPCSFFLSGGFWSKWTFFFPSQKETAKFWKRSCHRMLVLGRMRAEIMMNLKASFISKSKIPIIFNIKNTRHFIWNPSYKYNSFTISTPGIISLQNPNYQSFSISTTCTQNPTTSCYNLIKNVFNPWIGWIHTAHACLSLG